jgi:AcrR family transcriptional regulator
MTNNIKQERRYRRTEALILNGLTTLLQQKSIKEITVRELADLVDINRSTFYLHYTDIYDLLEKTEQRLLQQLMDAVNENWTLPETPKNFFAFLEQTFNILSENAQLCSALIGPNGDIAFLRNIEKMIRVSRPCARLRRRNSGNRISSTPFPLPLPGAWGWWNTG